MFYSKPFITWNSNYSEKTYTDLGLNQIKSVMKHAIIFNLHITETPSDAFYRRRLIAREDYTFSNFF